MRQTANLRSRCVCKDMGVEVPDSPTGNRALTQPNHPTKEPSRPPRLGRLRVTIVLLLALGVGLLLWLTGGSASKHGSTASAQPKILTASALRQAAGSSATPIYWAGLRPNTRLELTQDTDGRVYVRYLTGAAAAGDPRPDFLTIGTYPVPDALASLRKLASPSGESLRHVPGGDLALVDPNRPASVYLTRPGSAYEVEVYDPSPRLALAVALSGAVRPAA